MGGPYRPATERDMLWGLDGDPGKFLGVLVSTGAAVNNATTTTPFCLPNGGSGPNTPPSFVNSLAGKVLLIQPSAAGFVLTSGAAAITLTNQTLPTGIGLIPGVSISSAERLVITMLPASAYLQWLPATGSANLFVWELQ